MKHTTNLIIILLTALSALSQSTAVTITVYGNKNLQVFIDSSNIPLMTGSANEDETSFDLNNLVEGQHKLRIDRINLNTNRPDNITTFFAARKGFDLQIKVNPDNSVETIEIKSSLNNEVLVPMSTLNFNNLVKNVKAQLTPTGKKNTIATAFNNTNNAFTTNQAKQLITLVTSETNRLELAKLSYRGITDKGNFYKLYDLLLSQDNQNALADHVYNYEKGDVKTAMSESDFNTLLQKIKQQWPVSTQMNSLVSAFNNPAHYFTTYQAGRLIQVVTGESDRLHLAKLSYRTITDRDNFFQILDLLNSLTSQNDLQAYVNNYNNSDAPNTAMSEADFNGLYQTIQSEWPVSMQMNSIANAFNNPVNFFTTSQAGRLIQMMNLESNRLQLAKLSYRTITDRNNFPQILDLLNSQANKNELQAYVSSYAGDITKPPMPDNDFNSLYQTILNQWPVSAQMTSLVNAFNKPTNYFTTFQAGRLIQLVSLESNRLQLAKLSYGSITDKVNFSQIHGLLNTQASKDQLTAYVNNYTEDTRGNTVKTPMPEADYNALYKSIQLKYLPFEKMTSLSDLFNTTTSYFTTLQAKKLIALVSSESNRLQLAKLSYRTVTDRENFSQLYDLLNLQANRNSLDAYAKAYKD